MHRQHGISLIGMILILITVVMIAILFMRIAPVYIKHYEVLSSMKSLNKTPLDELASDPAADAHTLKNRLLNQLYVNNIESIQPEQIKITPYEEGVFKIQINYTVIKHLVGNVSLLFTFKAVHEVKTHEN